MHTINCKALVCEMVTIVTVYSVDNRLAFLKNSSPRQVSSRALAVQEAKIDALANSLLRSKIHLRVQPLTGVSGEVYETTPGCCQCESHSLPPFFSDTSTDQG